jgi:archaemetzincin
MSSIAWFLGIVAGLLQTPAPSRRPSIAVALIGNASRASLDALAPILRETFAAEIVAAPAVPLPSSAWDPSRRQYRSTGLLDLLASAKKPEWERLLGIADVDLYVPELNFVFGEADSRRGVAVFSVARLATGADQALQLRRNATEAIHELGHTYGLSHCESPTCVMWFSNTLAESDRKGTRFCPAHARELAENRAGILTARRISAASPPGTRLPQETGSQAGGGRVPGRGTLTARIRVNVQAGIKQQAGDGKIGTVHSRPSTTQKSNVVVGPDGGPPSDGGSGSP